MVEAHKNHYKRQYSNYKFKSEIYCSKVVDYHQQYFCPFLAFISP